MKQFTSPADYEKRFTQRDELWNQFKRYALVTDSVSLDGLSALQETGLRERLEAYLGRFRWRNNGYFFILNHDDSAVKKALEEIAKK